MNRESYFDSQVTILYEEAKNIMIAFLRTKHSNNPDRITIPSDFKETFFNLVDKVNLGLMEDKDNFYGYFLFQMAKEIRFDISSPTAVNFKRTKYVIYFNPIIFLTLTMKQMETTIKHEILHIVSLHLLRAKEIRTQYGTLAMNIAMDIVVNTYLDHLPPYAATLAWANANYTLKLLPFESFEYYAENIQMAIELLETSETAATDDSKWDEKIKTDYNPATTHDIWLDSSDIDEKTLQEFTEKFISNAQKGSIPDYLENIIASLKNSTGELPWNLYLKRLMGTIEGNKKKTVTRKNRRQPDRFDLRGQLRSHKAKIIIALDISGSITDEEFYLAMKEVLSIIKNYTHEITIVECDDEIRRVYTANSIKDIKERMKIRGGTKFSPVFEYANYHKVNLLVYFTDGQGEVKLQTIPRGYKTLWIIPGKSSKLSLQEAYGVVKKLNNIEKKDNTPDTSDVIFRDGYSMNSQESAHI